MNSTFEVKAMKKLLLVALGFLLMAGPGYADPPENKDEKTQVFK